MAKRARNEAGAPTTGRPRKARGTASPSGSERDAPETFTPGQETGPDRAADIGAPDAGRAASTASRPREEDIRRRAYQRFLERGGAHGKDFEDWLAAELDLIGR
jgi:hypothetical protein